MSAYPTTLLERPPLLHKLLEKQGELSDYQFARVLGIKRVLWNHTRIGRRRIGPTLIRAILCTYPELTSDVNAFQAEPRGE